jgi:N-acetylmuramoyl-L-alanine amidase
MSTLQTVSASIFRAFRHIGVVIIVAVASATVFTMWSPSSLLPTNVSGAISVALATQASSAIKPATAVPPTPTTSPRPLLGIVAGHSGPQNDPGAVCPDGLTEASINLNVANRVKASLEQAGYKVDLLSEFDDRLNGYKALALISIHADSCAFINDEATGFKVARALFDQVPEKSDRLVACLTDRYKKRTAMNFHAGSITYDMTQYHGFNEIDANTPDAIIETGFLNKDRDMLTNHPDLVAQGITEGILCYVRNEPVP